MIYKIKMDCLLNGIVSISRYVENVHCAKCAAMSYIEFINCIIDQEGHDMHPNTVQLSKYITVYLSNIMMIPSHDPKELEYLAAFHDETYFDTYAADFEIKLKKMCDKLESIFPFSPAAPHFCSDGSLARYHTLVELFYTHALFPLLRGKKSLAVDSRKPPVKYLPRIHQWYLRNGGNESYESEVLLGRYLEGIDKICDPRFTDRYIDMASRCFLREDDVTKDEIKEHERFMKAVWFR